MIIEEEEESLNTEELESLTENDEEETKRITKEIRSEEEDEESSEEEIESEKADGEIQVDPTPVKEQHRPISPKPPTPPISPDRIPTLPSILAFILETPQSPLHSTTVHNQEPIQALPLPKTINPPPP